MKTMARQHYLIGGNEVGLEVVAHFGVNIFRRADPLGWHEHPGGVEFVFILEGSVTFELTDHHQIHLNGGEFSYMPASMTHHALDDQNAPCRMSWFVLRTDRPANSTANLFTPDEHAEFIRRLAPFGPCTRTFAAEALPLFATLEDSSKTWLVGDHSALRAASLRSCVLSLLLHGLERLENEKARTSNDYVRAAIAYMQKHLAEPLTMTDIAGYLGFSDSRFYAMFKNATGQTPNDYLTRLRISRAKELIGKKDDSLATIAAATGLSSSQYLCRVFRKYTGHRPGKYRNTEYSDPLPGRQT